VWAAACGLGLRGVGLAGQAPLDGAARGAGRLAASWARIQPLQPLDSRSNAARRLASRLRRFFFGGADHHAARRVMQAHRVLRLVAVLPARSAGGEDVDAGVGPRGCAGRRRRAAAERLGMPGELTVKWATMGQVDLRKLKDRLPRPSRKKQYARRPSSTCRFGRRAGRRRLHQRAGPEGGFARVPTRPGGA